MAAEKQRQRGPRAYDVAMRKDGFVTASEIAVAMGVSLPTVHAGIRDGKIPGKVIEGIGGGHRWYVDPRKMLREFPKDGPTSVRQAIAKLVLLVKP